ncbi:unnamed protein product, partial [Prorocentrum cordatum]
ILVPIPESLSYMNYVAFHKRLDNIDARVNSLKGMIREVREEVEHTQVEVSTMKEQVEDLEIELTNLKADMEVLAFGFSERKESKVIKAELKNVLAKVLPDNNTAKIDTVSDPAKMGIITFDTFQDKIKFYKAIRTNTDPSILGKLFFRNNLTK